MTLYLLPNTLSEEGQEEGILPGKLDQIVPTLDALIVESEKAGRRFLKRFSYPEPKTFRSIALHLLNEHSAPEEKRALADQVAKGGRWGLVSDCGMPCLADPGADLVLALRSKGIPIEAFAGPSSLLLALVLSGLGGQHFTFHGYLPKEEGQRVAFIKAMERRSKEEKSTHLFIETPYRNAGVLKNLIDNLSPSTWLSIACDLTAPTQEVYTLQVSAWKKRPLPPIEKRPCVFLIRH